MFCCFSLWCSTNSQLKASVCERPFCVVLTCSLSLSVCCDSFSVFLCVFLRNMQRHNMTMCQFHPRFASLPGSHAKVYAHTSPSPPHKHAFTCALSTRVHMYCTCSRREQRQDKLEQLFIFTLSHDLNLFVLPNTPRHTHVRTHPDEPSTSLCFTASAIWLYNKWVYRFESIIKAREYGSCMPDLRPRITSSVCLNWKSHRPTTCFPWESAGGVALGCCWLWRCMQKLAQKDANHRQKGWDLIWFRFRCFSSLSHDIEL